MNTPPAPLPIAVHVNRIYSEYLEMPGLRLTGPQAERLLGLEPALCGEAMQFLVDAGFLRRTDNGQYVRLTEGVVETSALRMAKAQLEQTKRRQAS